MYRATRRPRWGGRHIGVQKFLGWRRHKRLHRGGSHSQLHFAGRPWHEDQREGTYGPGWACRRCHSEARSSPASALVEAAPSPPGLGPVSRAAASGCPYEHASDQHMGRTTDGFPRSRRPPEDNGTRARTQGPLTATTAPSGPHAWAKRLWRWTMSPHCLGKSCGQDVRVRRRMRCLCGHGREMRCVRHGR